MVSEAERMARAGEYVLGRMNGRERERAERDLETDERFRAAVMIVAERMRVIGGGDPAEAAAVEAMWAGLTRHLAALPHMQAANLSETLSHSFPLEGGGKRPPSGARERAKHRFSLLGGLQRLRFFLFGRLRRHKAPEAVALLETSLRDTAATLELTTDGRLRLLLLQQFALEADEQLSLWALHGDGPAERLAGFPQRAELWLAAPFSPAQPSGYALARERISLVPASRITTSPLAEGLLNRLPDFSGAPLPGQVSGDAVPSATGSDSIFGQRDA